MKPTIVLFGCLIVLSVLIPISNVFADHFPSPKLSYVVCDYFGKLSIDGAEANAGDEIAVFDNNNVLCGKFKLVEKGQYGFLHIYGDDPQTSVDEGARSGEALLIKVWDSLHKIEYSGKSILLSPGIAIGMSLPSEIPPMWYSDVIYVLNITVSPQPTHVKGDHNANGKIDIADILIELHHIAK